jgi:hypothetical protein
MVGATDGEVVRKAGRKVMMLMMRRRRGGYIMYILE